MNTSRLILAVGMILLLPSQAPAQAPQDNVPGRAVVDPKQRKLRGEVERAFKELRDRIVATKPDERALKLYDQKVKALLADTSFWEEIARTKDWKARIEMIDVSDLVERLKNPGPGPAGLPWPFKR